MAQGLSVLSLNLHKGFSSFNRRFVLHELRDAIREVHADLVFLQEVIGDHSLHQSRFDNWPQVPQYEFLADSIWNDFAYGKNAVYQEGHHGNAILSKYPILEWQNIDVSSHSSEKRGILHCKIEYGSQILHAICLHFGLVEKFRLNQLERLQEFLEREIGTSEPAIIAGDFNDWRKRLHRSFEKESGFSEIFQMMNGRLSRTFPSFLPLLPLDRIYVRNFTPVRELGISAALWRKLSDHRPLCAHLEPSF